MTLRIGYINAVLALIVVALLGVACYLHLDCRNLEALLAEGRLDGSESAESPVAVILPASSSMDKVAQLQEGLAALETEREQLLEELGEDAEKEPWGEDRLLEVVNMEELAELLPEDQYMRIVDDLVKYRNRYRHGSQDFREAIRLLDELGVSDISPAERERAEEYMRLRDEYIDGVLAERWSDVEAQERYEQLKGMADEIDDEIYSGRMRSLHIALGVKTEEELGEILEKESGIFSALFMSGWVYNDRIWWNAYAREIWATDSPSEDYGFDPEHPYLELDGYHIRELMNWRRP